MNALNSALETDRATEREHAIETDSDRESDGSASAGAMLTRTQLAELQPRAHASPGLMRRRYSLPETIMRKFRVARQSSDSEEGAGGGGPARSAGESPRRARRPTWARPPPAACRCARPPPAAPCSSDTPPTSPSTAKEAPPAVPERDAPFEVLEIAVSESSSSPPVPPAPEADVDEYVSRVLVESLASLGERLDAMPGAGGARRLGVVATEIKVRLQNAGVNTVVHLSPTSNNQIIFGNEELCGDGLRAPAPTARDDRRACDDPPASAAHVDDRASPPSAASPPPSPPSPPRSDAEAFDAILLRQDNVNGAVLRQIQKLFRDELRLSDEMGLRGESVSHVEISNVDVYLGGGAGDTISVGTRARDEPLADVGAGNYYRGVPGGAALVPRRPAVPHSASMEVNTSSSEDADLEPDPLASDATSLVDSLDDPASPRAPPPPPPRRARLARSAVDVLALLPEGPSPPAHPPPVPPRAEAFYIGIRDEAPTPTPPPARVAEYMPERIRQKLHRRHRRRELRAECARRGKVRRLRDELQRRRRDEGAALAVSPPGEGGARDEAEAARRRRREPPAPARPERRPARARPALAPAPASVGRAPRRIYQKSEIREGDKCIEILEILEYASGSRGSPETTLSEESARARRSRIPVPVAPPARDHMRLTGGDARALPPPLDLLLGALTAPAPAPACAAPPPPRSRSNSLRFRRVFDMIPEERSSLSVDSPEPAPAPARVSTRSACTSPRRVRSRTTMTSPARRSAATSPPPPREGSRHEGSPRRWVRGARGAAEAESSEAESSESGGSLLCSLAPRWLARPRRRARREPPPAPGGWSVTVAGSCRAALPADVEMRLRFPHERPSARRDHTPAPAPAHAHAHAHQECGCAPPPPRPAPPPAPAPAPAPSARHDRLTLTMKNEAQDSSVVATRSTGRAAEQLPELETYRASRNTRRASVKTRRGYSLHCWLPDDEPAPLRANNGLSVLGCAIIPELKPRVPTMSERDLTRVYTPRHYLRS